ncbi:hypothetical protein AG1IA_05876 [Rhizoctonia solani AG-1 IA]|uniref:Secreted protein n=1 Tax=Thanatephorus cucumeris (strain AG1-IA) TaxID=983506 RepID=L8WQ14_THACA|nr:hypothetical protein AG1IA_05876 [Rhizoctonia solani AG-1 IA]
MQLCFPFMYSCAFFPCSGAPVYEVGLSSCRWVKIMLSHPLFVPMFRVWFFISHFRICMNSPSRSCLFCTY